MLRVAVIGLGYWGPNLLRNFAAADDVQVVTACDQDPQRLARALKLYPGVAGVTDFTAVLRDPGVDLVALATPVHTHYPLVKAALQAGKHVLVEKPLTNSIAHAEELAALAQAKGRVLLVDHTFVYHPAVEKIQNVIRSGDLGDIWYYDSVRINLGIFQHDVSVLWDLAVHDLALMTHLIAPPVEWVQAAGARHAGQELESIAYVTVQFAGSVLGHVHVNWLSPVKVRQIILGGSKRMLVYDDNLVTEKVKIYDRGVDVKTPEGLHQALVQYRMGDMYAPALSVEEALRRMVNHCVDCCRTGRTPLTGGAAGLRVVRILVAAEKALKSGPSV